MPNFTHTPEALLGRNDSKNPSTTCKGMTSSGRPCRRALASPKTLPFGNKKAGLGGVVAIVEEDGEVENADFYCWQHKDQAERRVAEEKKQSPGRRAKRRSAELFPLQERSSIDTMVQKLGLDAVPEEKKTEKPARATRVPKAPRRTETHDFAPSHVSQAPHAEKYGFGQSPERRGGKKPGFWASLCCMMELDEDYVEVVRHRKRVEQSRPQNKIASTPPAALSAMPVTNPRPLPDSRLAAVRPETHHLDPSRPQTGRLLNLIPQHLSPQTTSALLAELNKRISPHDEEGYIYIFWLTPQTKQSPAEETARSLLSPARPQHDRRISDVMTEYSFDASEPKTQAKKTIMLKIGRANNVTRRMNEWQRQCGYALNLVRWYPYVPSSTAPSPQRERSDPSRKESETVRKVPFVKRVERLIHLELAEKQVKRQCRACGKEHREWFEVEASQAGVKAVDECVRRWVGWAERQAEV